VFSREAANTNYIVFSLILWENELMIYHVKPST